MKQRFPGVVFLVAVFSAISATHLKAETTEADSVASSAAAPTSASTAPRAPDTRPVTQEQFRAWTDWVKRSMEQVSRQSSAAAAAASKATSGAGTPTGHTDEVDLSSVDAKTVGGVSTQVAPTYGLGAPSIAAPAFKTYFDLNLMARPGSADNLTFNSYHAFLFFEIIPRPDLQFSFDVNPTPTFFELDYQATPRLQLRAGKIWIPFDDLSPQTPHNLFGGRIGISRLSPSSNLNAYLPDIWTELGVGAKYVFVDTRDLELEGHVYVVNGFTGGGNDPTGKTDPTGAAYDYPKFNGLLTSIGPDNNRDKAVGTRVHALFFNQLGVGGSFYSGRWTNETDPSERINIFGLDAQYRIQRTEFRAGASGMNIGLLSGGNFQRGGFYGEVGQKFGTDDRWKILARGGGLQLDNRVIDVTDETIVGATLVYRPGLVEISLEHSRDLNHDSPAKSVFTLTDLRIAMAF